MSEKPILMNGVMVRAILDGRKTETRRPAKIQDRDYSTWSKEAIDAVIRHHSPYSVGDHLYVRETWWAVEVDQIGIQYCVFDDEFVAEESGAKYPEPSELRFLDRQDWEYGRHPNIHMPKKHARLWLEVTGVSAEKVQDITEDGAIAEGIIHSHQMELSEAQQFPVINLLIFGMTSITKKVLDGMLIRWYGYSNSRG